MYHLERGCNMAIVKRLSLGFGRKFGLVEPLSGHYWWAADDKIV